MAYYNNFSLTEINEYLIEIRVPIIWFLTERYITDKNILELLLGDRYSKEKSFDAYLKDTLFVFEGFRWYFTIKSFLTCIN